MLLGPILSITVIVTTVLLVVLTDASPIIKVGASVLCAGTFFAPNVLPSIAIAIGPAKALLSIVIIVYLKQQRLIA